MSARYASVSHRNGSNTMQASPAYATTIGFGNARAMSTVSNSHNLGTNSVYKNGQRQAIFYYPRGEEMFHEHNLINNANQFNTIQMKKKFQRN